MIELRISASRTAALVLISTMAIAQNAAAMDFMALRDFARQYAAAWSSQDPEQLAALYAPDGTLTVNDGEPAVGREAIADKARGFMEAFPDMVVEMRAVQMAGDDAEFHWLWTGTNTGPGGTGRPVRIDGQEVWKFNADGLIQESQGNYDQAEYSRQVGVPE